MCMFCAAIPAAAAAGAKINADQKRSPDKRQLPISRIASLTMLLLLACSIAYHTLTYRP